PALHLDESREMLVERGQPDRLEVGIAHTMCTWLVVVPGTMAVQRQDFWEGRVLHHGSCPHVQEQLVRLPEHGCCVNEERLSPRAAGRGLERLLLVCRKAKPKIGA